jgi:hypothetical protein
MLESIVHNLADLEGERKNAIVSTEETKKVNRNYADVDALCDSLPRNMTQIV